MGGGEAINRSEHSDILCVMRLPPDLNGHGGSQRAWHLVEALRPHGKVHFVLVYRNGDDDCFNTSLAPLEPLVESITRINIAGWQGAKGWQFGIVPPGVWNILKMGSQDAPHLSRREVHDIAARLPVRKADIVFAGRLSSAVMVQDMMDQSLVSCGVRVVDFDDIMSKFRLRQARNADLRLKGRALRYIDSQIIALAERQIARSWHGVSVCTEEDVASLRASHPGATVLKVPNVVHRDLLQPPMHNREFRLLFVGNLSFPPNVEGLRLFVAQAWPAIRRTVPEARLTVVGLNPSPDVVVLTSRDDIELHANAADLRPFYEACHAVIAPILFGSGTRIKILEAMAYGRPVISTSLGAEGMGLEHGRHLLIADSMAEFANAAVNLRRDPALRATLVARAHEFQQKNYTPPAINAAVAELIERGRLNAARA